MIRDVADDRHGWRLRALIVVLWRSGLLIQAALALSEADLDSRCGSLLVRDGKGGRRREIGVDAWGWEQLRPRLAARLELPVGPLFCVVDGPTRGGAGRAPVSGSSSAATPPTPLSGVASPHELRHAHLDLLQGIDTEEIIATVHARRAPMMSATAGLRL